MGGRTSRRMPVRNSPASIALAAGAKSRLLDDSVDIVKSTAKARQEIAKCVQTLSEVADRLKAYAEEEET